MKNQDCPKELRKFLKLMDSLNRYGDISTVWEDFLTMSIAQFNVPEEWGNTTFGELDAEHKEVMNRYTPAEQEALSAMFREMFRVIASELGQKRYEDLTDVAHTNMMLALQGAVQSETTSGWYDFFGDFYQELTGKYKTQHLGQFFTPPSLCSMMAEIVSIDMEYDNDEPHYTVNNRRTMCEPAAGSGRTALAVHAKAPGTTNCYLQDLDRICCKMSVLNMLIHGIPGQVICGNSLDPGDYRRGWSINKYLYHKRPPNQALMFTPHVRAMPKEGSVIWLKNQYDLEQYYAKKALEPAPANKPARLKKAA